MQSTVKSILALTSALVLIAACDGRQNAYNAQQGGITGGGGVSKQDFGTILGGVGGAVVGSQFGKGSGRVATTAVGTLLGAAIGSSVGASLDRADMTYFNQTSQRALETGQPGQALPWNNPKSGNSGVVIPQAPYKNDAGQYCREYQNKITVGGQTQSAYGTACRQPDGSWQIVSE